MYHLATQIWLATMLLADSWITKNYVVVQSVIEPRVVDRKDVKLNIDW